MSVEIEPVELAFRRPFDREVGETLRIKNPGSEMIAFKVKTTAPKQYCVRPNSGTIVPGDEVEVSVLLQAMKQEPEPNAKCKDKFLVQSAAVPEQLRGEEDLTVNKIFDEVEKSDVQEKKIRVSWLQPDHSSLTPNRSSLLNGGDGTPDVSRVYDSPGQDLEFSSGPSDSGGKDGFSLGTIDLTNPGSIVPKASAAVASAASATASAIKPTYEELKAELEKLKTQLLAYKDNSGLRQRGIKGIDGEKPVAQQLATAARQGVEGVPVPLVAGLCFLSFLIAYFFF